CRPAWGSSSWAGGAAARRPPTRTSTRPPARRTPAHGAVAPPAAPPPARRPVAAAATRSGAGPRPTTPAARRTRARAASCGDGPRPADHGTGVTYCLRPARHRFRSPTVVPGPATRTIPDPLPPRGQFFICPYALEGGVYRWRSHRRPRRPDLGPLLPRRGGRGLVLAEELRPDHAP